MTKVLVSLDPQLLAQLDQEAGRRRVSRSALLSELVAKGLNVPFGPGLRPEVRRALGKLDGLFQEREGRKREDSTAAIRAERDAR